MTLFNAPKKTAVTFDWVAYSGSRPVVGTKNGHVSLTASKPNASIVVRWDEISASGENPVRTPVDQSTVFYVCFRNLKNALFSNEREVIYFRFDTDGTVDSAQFPGTGDINDSQTAFNDNSAGQPYNSYASYTKVYSFAAYPRLLTALHWGIISHVDASVVPPTGSAYSRYKISNLNKCGGDLAQRNRDGSMVVWADAVGQYNNGATQWTNLTHSYDLNDYPTTIAPNSTLRIMPAECRIDDQRSIVAKTVYAVSDNRAPQVLSWEIPAGEYGVGDLIPVVVRLSEPVRANAELIVNDVAIRAAESGQSNVLTFPYEVQEVDNDGLYIKNICVKDIVGNELNAPPSADSNGMKAQDVRLVTPNKAHAFTSFTAEINYSNPVEPMLNLAVRVIGKDDVSGKNDSERQRKAETYSNWMLGYFSGNTGGAGHISHNMDFSKKIYVRVSGIDEPIYLVNQADDLTGRTLTAAVNLKDLLNTGDDGVNIVSELYVDDELMFGRAATVDLRPLTYITAADLQPINITVKPTDDKSFSYTDSETVLYSLNLDSIYLSFTLPANKDFSFARPQDFEWVSSDESIAKVQKTGLSARVDPTGKAGRVRFRLIANNGGIAGKSVSVNTIYLTFGKSETPFLKIHDNVIKSLSGQGVAVLWTSNLIEKNGSTPTVFSITVQREDSTEAPYITAVTGTPERFLSAATIPAEALPYLFDFLSQGQRAVRRQNV